MITSTMVMFGLKGLSSFGSLQNSKSASKIAIDDMKFKTQIQKDLVSKNEATRLDAMKRNYVTGVRDANMQYIDKLNNLSNEATGVSNSIALGTGSTTGYDANNSSYLGDSYNELQSELSENYFANYTSSIEDYKRGSEMNLENRSQVRQEASDQLMQLSIDESQFITQQKAGVRAAKTSTVFSIASAVVGLGGEIYKGKYGVDTAMNGKNLFADDNVAKIKNDSERKYGWDFKFINY